MFPGEEKRVSIGNYIIEHLEGYYSYRNSPLENNIVGSNLNILEKDGDEKQTTLFKGTNLGLVLKAIKQDGIYGSSFRHNVTGQFNNAVRWSLPENRIDRTGTAEDKPTKELIELNNLMPVEVQKRPDKFTPVVLAFDITKLSINDTIDNYNLHHVPEKRITGDLSLNDLTYESKKSLVKELPIREIRDWMDKEWHKIIRNIFPK